MRKFPLVTCVITGLVILLSCAKGNLQETRPLIKEEPGKPIAENPVKMGWEAEWERTFKAAQKEGRIVVYTDSIGIRPASLLFTKKYGIPVEVLQGRGAELGRKTIQERSAGLNLVDIQVSGLNTLFGVLKASGATVLLEKALILPEVKDPKLWLNGELPWADESHHIFSMTKSASAPMAINTEYVKPSEVKSYYDLLNPKWKDKLIINDPTVAGAGFNAFATLIFNKILDEDFFYRLVKNNVAITRDQRLQVEWLAKGKYYVTMWHRPSEVVEFQDVGSTIEQVTPREGTQLSSAGGNLSLIDKAPHPNASVIFINWLLSKEGAQIFQDEYGRQSAREDIPFDKVPPILRRTAGTKYFPAANEMERWVMKEQSSYLDRAREIFGPLSK